MNSTRKKVVWDSEARQQLNAICLYIKKDSPQNAIKVKDDIFTMTRKLALHPEIYSLDKYKAGNDGSYRAFEKHRYRVAYKVSEKKIIVLRVRHTSMEPLVY